MEEARKLWYRQRVEAINARVSAFDVLRANGVSLTQASDDAEEQFSCPFHGADAKPSARIYPAGDRSSHVWCFVCQEKNWDAIGLWRKFNNLKTFGQALSSIERAYGLKTPETPRGGFEGIGQTETEDVFKRMYLVCEVRLLNSKRAYRESDDLRGYLTAGSVLDRTKHKVDTRQWNSERGAAVLRMLLDKIQAKVSACPVG